MRAKHAHSKERRGASRLERTGTGRRLGRLAALVALAVAGAVANASVEVVARPDASKGNRHYTGNRPPLAPSPLIRLSIGCVRPEGWTRRMLELQADGFHGRLEELSRFLVKEGNAWLSPKGVGKLGWEEQPYWLKGYLNCAFLLDREDMLKEARLWIEGAIRSQQPDGWFGPGTGRTGVATRLKGREDLWPNMVMLFCLQSHYEQTGDERVLTLMKRYFRYLLQVPEERFLVGYWPRMRAGDLLYSLYWCYNRTGEKWLLELGPKIHRRAARWDEGVINWHNVNIAQGFREPAIYFMQSRDPKYIQASEYVWHKVRELYGQVPGGMFGGDENCRPGHAGPRQAIETCGVVEEMLSDELMLSITGDASWADRCENAAFNTFPATMTADLKALRYLTAPNQPQSDHKSKCPGVQNCGPMFQMNPHIHRCCQHNSGHGWPYFVQHLWYAAPGDGLAALLYAPCKVSARVGDGTKATIREETRYPFEEQIRFVFQTEKPVSFPLLLRVPAWCSGPKLVLNGKAVPVRALPQTYIRIERTWKSGDRLELTLPMRLRIHEWTRNRRTVSVERGPLTYSLKIKERYVRSGGTDKWPAWDIFPDSPWNYGLALDPNDPAAGFELIRKPWPQDNQPWRAEAAPIELKAKARRIPEWTLDSKGLVREVQESPVYSEQPEETVTLIPMGAARLRISAFPVIGTGPDARRWKTPPAKLLSASHCWEADTVEALEDGKVPKNSNDHSIPRFTWWPRRGTVEWVQRRFSKPRKISRLEIYWFDDTGQGYCRTPASYRVFYQTAEGDWRPAPNPRGLGAEKDRFNVTEFDPVVAKALRVEARLKPGFSGGILEWRIK